MARREFGDRGRLAAFLLLVLSQTLLLDPSTVGAAVTLAATLTAGAALAWCLHLTARSVPPVPAARVRTTLRERALRTAFLAQRDPDAAGRPRPRAPGCRPSANA